MSQLTTKTLRVDGMTCTGCEGRIERKLRSAGVADVVARYSDGSVQVTCDTDVIDFRTVGKLIEELDYRVVEDNVVEDNVVQDNVKKEGAQRRPRVDALTAIWVAVALYELYALLDRFGLLDVFYAFPEARTGMGWGMLFVIGALTSVHCIAMCGGINLSQSLIQTQGGRARSAPGFAAPPETPGALIQTQGGRARSAPPSMPRAMVEHLGGRWAVLRSGLLYNLGRLASYTLVGGIVGALGSVVSLSGSARGWVQLIAGAFMVVMGLNMLNVFPWLRRLNPRMPKVFADKIHSGGTNRTPLYVGLLNGLMPCGPLQAMQIYALSTGSFVRGAAAMFFFGAGTLPLMFGLSALSSVLSKKFTRGMMTVGATMVVVLGVAMFGNGMNLSGVTFMSGFARSAVGGAEARMEGGVQVVRTELEPGRYEPIVVKVGAPVRWTIHAEPGTLNGCNNRIVIPEYARMQKKLATGDNIVEFTPTRSGTFAYTCWMGMIRGRITVLDETGNPDGQALAAGLPADIPDASDVFGESGDSDPFAEDPFEVIETEVIEDLKAFEAADADAPRCACCRQGQQ